MKTKFPGGGVGTPLMALGDDDPEEEDDDEGAGAIVDDPPELDDTVLDPKERMGDGAVALPVPLTQMAVRVPMALKFKARMHALKHQKTLADVIVSALTTYLDATES